MHFGYQIRRFIDIDIVIRRVLVGQVGYVWVYFSDIWLTGHNNWPIILKENQLISYPFKQNIPYKIYNLTPVTHNYNTVLIKVMTFCPGDLKSLYEIEI